MPDADLGVPNASVAAEVFGVTPRPIFEAWPDSAVEARRRQLTIRARAKRYLLPNWSAFSFSALLVAGAVTLFVGLHDLFSVEGVGVRLLALILSAGAATMCVGALSLYTRWRVRYVLAFLGSIVAAVILVLFSASSIASAATDSAVRVLVAGAVLLPGALAGVQLWKRGGLAIARLFARGLPALVTSFVTVGTVVGVTEFWYQNVHVPGSATPVLDISIGLTQSDALVMGNRIVYADFEITNPGDQRVTVVASHFDMDGMIAARPADIPTAAIRPIRDRDLPLGRTLGVRSRAILRSGELSNGGSFLAPNESLKKRIVVAVPKKTQIVTAHAYLIVGGQRVSPRKLALVKQRLVAHTIYRKFNVYEPSWWWSLSGGPVSIFTFEALYGGKVGYQCAGFPAVQAYIGGRDEDPDLAARTAPCATFASRRLTSHFQLFQTDASAELAVDSADRPASGG